MVGDINIGGIVLTGVAAVLLVLGLLGVILIGADKIFATAGLAIPYLGLCGWLLVVLVAVVALLWVFSRWTEG